MNSRARLLSQIEKNKPALVELPNVPSFQNNAATIEVFETALLKIGGNMIEMNDLTSLVTIIQNKFPGILKIASSLPIATINVNEWTNQQTLEAIELVILEARLGVAENGAVWLSDTDMLHRALPFITQHLVVVLNRKDIVATMHHAYEKIQLPDYGVFIAGPSKTADIEQSLVIGAHGARTMTVLLI